jgi:HEAT repeat protein
VSATSIQRMPKRRRILFVAVLGILIIAGVIAVNQWPQAFRLTWKGKSAAYWISQLNNFDLEGANVSAEEFLFAAGPEVVPALVKGLRRRNSWLADRWYDAYFKLGKWQKHFQVPTKRAHFRANAACGLGLLGRAASNAVPALLLSLNDSDQYVRGKAAEALGRIGGNRERIVPELIAGLSSTNDNHRSVCAWGLARCLPGNAQAAMVLRGLLKDTAWNLRCCAADSLWRDDSDREASLAVLLVAL